MAIATVKVAGRVLDPSGAPVPSGVLTARLSQAAQVLDGGVAEMVGAEVRAPIAADGSVELNLVPNDAIEPPGTTYRVSYAVPLPSGRLITWHEHWALASSPSPIALGDVQRVEVEGAPVFVMGPAGSAGPAGPAGPKGDTGEQGPPGSDASVTHDAVTAALGDLLHLEPRAGIPPGVQIGDIFLLADRSGVWLKDDVWNDPHLPSARALSAWMEDPVGSGQWGAVEVVINDDPESDDFGALQCGRLLAWDDVVSTSGSALGAPRGGANGKGPWTALFLNNGIWDGWQVQRLQYQTVQNTWTKISGNPTDASTAVAVILNAAVALANVSARLLEVRNNDVSKFSIDKDGMPRLGIGNSAAPPTADANHRGAFWFRQGGTGVADTLQVCIKNADGTYSWKTVTLS